jgi:hypothetical protein
MTSQFEFGNARSTRERPDLRQQYRPIGIGAVAAALAATNGDSSSGERKPRTDERTYLDTYLESLAA